MNMHTARLEALQSGDVAGLIAANRTLFGGYTMVMTTSADVIIPEVWEDLAQPEFTGAMRLGGSAAVLSSDKLVGQPGETISFPRWSLLSDMEDLSETVPLVPEKLSQSSAFATIKEAGKAFEVTDRSKLVGLGDPEAEARRQFGILAARKVDLDLIAAAQADETAQGGSTPRTVTVTGGKFGYLSAVVPSIATFGDEWDPSVFAGLYIHSTAFADLIADPQFVDQSKLGATTPVLTGQLGVLAGVPIAMTDRLAAGKFLLLKRNSLGLMYKQRPVIEADRDILARTNVVAITQHYATKRLSDKGVLVGTITA